MKTEKVVNIFVKLCVGGLIVIAGMAVAHRAFASDNKVIVCEADRNGKMCCWDTAQYGPNRPWICN
jgi:hypothetical protein